MALTTAQQAAINELAEGIGTVAENLDAVLEAADEARSQLQETIAGLPALQAEEAREQALREQLEATLAGLDADVVGALGPLTNRVAAMNSALQTPEADGGSPITPGEPTTPDTGETPAP